MAKRPLDFQMGAEDEILAELRRILEQAADEIEQELAGQAGEGAGEAVQRAQAEAIARAVKQHLKGDWDSISSVLSEARKLAATASVQAFYEQISGPMSDLLGKDGLNSLISAESVRASNTINTVMARLSDSRRSLSQQVWATQAMSNRWLDSKINQALARGWDARRLADEVREFVNPNTPGGASYAAMRLARTEINNAFHSQTIEQMWNSGVVEYVKWNLSRSHPDRDICDDLAEHRLSEPIPGAPDPDEPEESDGREFVHLSDDQLNNGSYISVGEETSFGRDGYGARKGLSEDENDALTLYEMPFTSHRTNSILRGLPLDGIDIFPYKNIPDEEAFVSTLDSAISRGSLNQDTLLYRGVRFSEELLAQYTPGSVVRDRGFVSTSASEKVAERFRVSEGMAFETDDLKAQRDQRWTFEIEAPKGSKGGTGAPSLYEIVLPRDSEFEIISRDEDSRTIRMRLI